MEGIGGGGGVRRHGGLAVPRERIAVGLGARVIAGSERRERSEEEE